MYDENQKYPGSIVAGLIGGSLNPKTKEGEVSQELSSIDRNMEILAKTLSELESKISPILMNEIESDEKNTEPYPTRFSEVANRLQGISQGINQRIIQVRNIIDRVQL